MSRECVRNATRTPTLREFYLRDPAVVVRELLGKRLWRETSAGLCGGRIVEVEAYLSRRDPACHAARGYDARNAAMFGPAGHAYVYMIHSRWCLNAVTEPEGVPSAILIRAIEPMEGLELMQQRRRTDIVRDLARGRRDCARRWPSTALTTAGIWRRAESCGLRQTPM